MPTALDEMAETFERAIAGIVIDTTRMTLTDIRCVGLAAVLRKHIEPMIAEAWLDAASEYGAPCDGDDRIVADNYAARIISTLLSPPTEGSKE
jgi:hypothetical protein